MPYPPLWVYYDVFVAAEAAFMLEVIIDPGVQGQSILSLLVSFTPPFGYLLVYERYTTRFDETKEEPCLDLYDVWREVGFGFGRMICGYPLLLLLLYISRLCFITSSCQHLKE